MIGFHDVTFPEDVSWGSAGGPIFKTHVYTAHRGYEKRNIEWVQPLMRFNVAYGVRTDEQMMRLIEFFNARQGRLHAFRYKNWANYKVVNRPIAASDGVSTRLPLYKFYGTQSARFYKRLRKIVRGSVTGVQLWADPGTEGVDYMIDYDTGEIHLAQALPYGKPVYAQSLEFQEAVRFTEDNIQIVIDAYNTQSLRDLELISIRDDFSAGAVYAPGDFQTGDPLYDQTDLILNFDPSGDLTTTVDQSQHATPVVMTGTARISTSRFRHNGGALSLGATGTCRLSGVNLDLGNAPFTIEGFFEVPQDGAVMQPMCGKWDTALSRRSYILRYNFVRRRVEFAISTDGIAEQIVLSYPWRNGRTNQFDHISVSRTEAWWYVLRINGEVVQTVRNMAVIQENAAQFSIGSYPVDGSGDGIFQGNIDSLRVTVGTTRTPHFERGKVPAPYAAT